MNRVQLRNTQPFYYALLSGKTAITDANGNRTGEYTESYGNATLAKGNVSPAKGNADLDVFGISTAYSKTIALAGTTPITETTALWIGFGEISTYSTTATYAAGAYAIYSGKIYKATAAATGTWDSSKWAEVEHNYAVVKVAQSLGSALVAIEEVK